MQNASASKTFRDGNSSLTNKEWSRLQFHKNQNIIQWSLEKAYLSYSLN